MSRRRAAAGAASSPPTGIPARHPAWVAAALATAACIVTTVTFHLWDSDLWQHLAVGRELWRLGAIPREHLWSWPTYGTPEVLPSWLFRALLWPFAQAGSVWGLFAWRWLTTLLAFGLLLAAARRMGARGFPALVVAALCALPWAQRTQLRPETLVAPLLALQLWIHESRRAPGGRDRSAWLPLIALVWANVHISYWIGLAVQLAYLLAAALGGRGDEGPRRRWPWLAAVGLASCAASFANPFGWRALAQPFEYWLTWRHEPIYQVISELAPVDWAANRRNLLWLLVAGWPLLLVLRLLRRRLDVAETLLAALFLGLAASAQRFVGFLALAAVPFVARDLGELLPRGPASPWVRAVLTAAFAVAGSLAEWRDPALIRGVGFDAREAPVGAADFIEREQVRGRGFNTFHLGGYLLWRFHPQRDRLPFMDIHQSGTREDRRLYALASTRDDAWRELDRRHGFDWVLLHRRRITDERWLDILDADSTFALVFLDDAAALWARRDGPLAALARRREYRWLAAGAARAERTGAAAADPARRPLLAGEVARVIAESRFHASGRLLEANLHLLEGRLEAAHRAVLAALAVDPDYPGANGRRAALALEAGRPAEALAAVEREIAIQGRAPHLVTLRERALSAAGR